MPFVRIHFVFYAYYSFRICSITHEYQYINTVTLFAMLYKIFSFNCYSFILTNARNTYYYNGTLVKTITRDFYNESGGCCRCFQ